MDKTIVISLNGHPEHYRLRDFLTRIAQPHEFLEATDPWPPGHTLCLGRAPRC